MPDVTRNWLFSITAQTAAAQGNVDALLLSIRTLKQEAANLNIVIQSSERPRYGYSQSGGLVAQNTSALAQSTGLDPQWLASQLNELKALREQTAATMGRATSYLDLMKATQVSGPSNAFGSGFDPSATSAMNAAFNGSAGIGGNASPAAMMAAWSQLLNQAGGQSSLGTGGNIFGTGPIAASGFPGYTPPPGQASFGQNQYTQGSLFGPAQNAQLAGNQNAALSQQVAALQAAAGAVAGNPQGVFGPQQQTNINNTTAAVGGYNSMIDRMLIRMALSIAIFGTFRVAMQAIQESIALMSQFEASAARVAFVLNESTTAANNLASSTQRIGAGYGISPAANGDAAIRISQVTANPGEQYKLAADGAKLAMLSGDNYGASVDNLIRIQRSFNLSLADTPQILDTIATIYRSTPSSIQEITQLLERLGPIAEATGMSMEQIGILAARTAQVSGASLGGVDNLFSRVQTNLDTKSVQKSLFDMGIGVTDAEGQVRPFLTVMSEVKAKIDELRASGQDTAALDIAAAIAGKRPEVLREFLVMLDQVNQKTPPLASANDLVAKSVDTLDIKVKTLTADWGIFLETVGNSQGLKAAADNLDLLVRMGIAEQEAINKGLNPIHSGIPGMPDEEHYRAVVAQQMRDDYNAAHPLPFGPGLAGVYTGGPSTLGNQAPPPATYEQNLVNTGILSASRLKEVNTQAITESEYAKLLQYSVARSSIEVGLWRDKLTSMGVIGKAQDDAIQKLKDQLAGASVEFNVNGTPRLATGAPAAYAQEGFSQMNNTGFQKLPIDSGNEDLFRTLMEKYRVQLEGLGLTQEGKPTVVGIEGAAGTPGEGILQRLDKMVIFQDAANLALQAIEKNTRPAISGVYNFPSGETPFVPLSSFELDRQTRAGMLSTATGGVDTKIFDGLTAGFNAPISDLKGAGTLFDGAVKGFSASALLIAAALQARAAVEAAGRQPVVDAAKTASDYLQLYGIGPNAGSFVPGTGKGTSNMGDMPLPPGRGPGLPSPLPVSVNWSNTTYVNIDSETIRTIVENKVIELMSTPDAQSGRGMY